MRTLAIELAPAQDPGQHGAPDRGEHRHDPERAGLELFDALTSENERPRNLRPSGSCNALPVPWVEPVDISNAVLFLASDEARYVTGLSSPIDAGTRSE